MDQRVVFVRDALSNRFTVVELKRASCVTRWSMKTKTSPFDLVARSRTGWRFLGGHVPLGVPRTSARALATAQSRGRGPASVRSEVGRAIDRPSRPSAIGTA